MHERPQPNKEELEDLRVGRLFEIMVKSEAWKLYVKLLDHHIDGKMNEVLNTEPRSGEDGVSVVLRSERSKGAILGLRLARGLAPGIVENQTKPLRLKLFGNSATDED